MRAAIESKQLAKASGHPKQAVGSASFGCMSVVSSVRRVGEASTKRGVI